MNLAAIRDKLNAFFTGLEREEAQPAGMAAGTNDAGQPSETRTDPTNDRTIVHITPGRGLTGSAPPAPDPALVAEMTALKAEVERQKAQVAAHEREVQMARGRQIDTEARSFAEQVVRDKRAMPGEKEDIEAAFRQAAADDQAYPTEVTFGRDAQGQEKKGSRIEAMRAQFAKRPEHVLCQELIKGRLPEELQGVAVFENRTTSDVPDDERKPTQERKDYLLSLTQEGKAVLRDRAASKNGGGH